MTSSLRARLFLIVGSAALALLLMLLGSALIGAQQSRDLKDVEQRLVPKLELEPRLETQFEHLREAMQDAVSAQDKVALEATLERRNELFDTIAQSKGLIDPSDAAVLRWTLHDYYESAREVSRRLIAGETGEDLVDRMARMQAQQLKVTDLIKRTTGLSRATLASSFATVQQANERAFRFRLTIGLLGLLVVLAFSVAASRSVLGALDNVSRGLSRFATSDFREQIPTTGLKELAKLAREANQMAANLQRLAEEREGDDWLKESQARLSDELRGDVEPGLLAERVVRFIAKRTGAVAAALYLFEAGGLKLRGRYALTDKEAFVPFDPAQESRVGEGLLLEATRGRELLVVEEVPDGFMSVRSGLGVAAPRALVFLPLARGSDVLGVLELALFKACPPEVRGLLDSVREMLVVSLQAARSRAALRHALERTQSQAEQLTAQEEELRANNQELHSQHEELRVANGELEAQRQVLSQRNGELEEARRRLQQKAEELGKMSSYKSQFLANMSHELRTPLNSMLLLSHLLAENEAGTLNEKQVEYSKTIHASGTDLLSLINQVLDLAKIEAGRQDLALEHTPLSRFADYARRVFEPLAAEKKLELDVSIAPGLPETIETDPQRVERVLTNLLGNAIKFTDRGRVSLRLERAAADTHFARPGLRPEGCLALVVSDTGIGISAEAHERVFAPFEQIDSHSTRRYAGTGLGLAISRESAALLGGELALASQPEQGSTFTCFLPFRRAAVASSLPPAPGPPTDERAQSGGRAPALSATPGEGRALVSPAQHDAPHILVVEDSVAEGDSLCALLRRERFDVTRVGNARVALEELERRSYQCMVLDLGLPDMDGLAVLETLRARPDSNPPPVIVHTGRVLDKRDIQRLEAYAEAVVLKQGNSAARLVEEVRLFVGRVTDEAAPRPRSQIPPAKAAPDASFAGLKLLLAEDDMRTVYALSAILTSKGALVLVADSGREALEILEANPDLDLVLMDLMMPEMDGYQAIRRLRADPRFEHVPVVALTAKAMKGERERCLEAGASDYVTKPVDTDKLLQTLQSFLPRGQRAAGG